MEVPTCNLQDSRPRFSSESGEIANILDNLGMTPRMVCGLEKGAHQDIAFGFNTSILCSMVSIL